MTHRCSQGLASDTCRSGAASKCESEDESVERGARHGLNPARYARPVRDRNHRQTETEGECSPHQTALVLRVLVGIFDRRNSRNEQGREKGNLCGSRPRDSPYEHADSREKQAFRVEPRPCPLSVEQKENEDKDSACGSG